MKRLMAILLAVALVVLQGRAAFAGESPVLAALAQQIEVTARTASDGDASPSAVRFAGAELQRKLEDAPAPVLVGRKWAVEKDLADSPADVSRLLDAARERVLLDGQTVPPPSVTDTFDHVSAMNDEGRVSITDLPSNVMGLFHYDTKNDPRGEIRLNNALAQITELVGDALAASVLFHEGGHAGDEDIAGEDVVKSEGRAFKRQYDYLHALYPTGEQLTTTRLRLERLYKKVHTPLVKIAMDFAATCDVLWGLQGTNGAIDEGKLADFIHTLYKSDGSPASPSA